VKQIAGSNTASSAVRYILYLIEHAVGASLQLLEQILVALLEGAGAFHGQPGGVRGQPRDPNLQGH